MKYELKALSFGETLGKAFNMYIDNFVALFFICLVLSVPLIFLTMNLSEAIITAYSEENFTPLIRSAFLFGIVTLILSAVESGFIINYVAHKYLGREIKAKDFFDKIKSSIIPIIGLSLLVGLITGIGLVLLVIPGIIIALGFMLSTQVLVIEKKSIIESMKRSWDLTKGKRFQIFGFLFIVQIISNVLNQLSELIAKSLIETIGSGAVLVGAVVSFFIASLTSPLQSCLIVLIYFNSRIEKEGFALEHLADQFSAGEEIIPIDQ